VTDASGRGRVEHGDQIKRRFLLNCPLPLPFGNTRIHHHSNPPMGRRGPAIIVSIPIIIVNSILFVSLLLQLIWSHRPSPKWDEKNKVGECWPLNERD